MQKLQELVWLWMILGFTILPAIRQFIGQMRRQLLIAKIERKRGTKVISMFYPLLQHPQVLVPQGSWQSLL